MDPFSIKKKLLMQKVRKDVTEFHTRGITFLGETEGVIQRSSGKVTNAKIMVFSIIVNDKRSLNIFFIENPNEILSFKRDYFAYQMVEYYSHVKPKKGVKGGVAKNISHYVAK